MSKFIAMSVKIICFQNVAFNRHGKKLKLRSTHLALLSSSDPAVTPLWLTLVFWAFWQGKVIGRSMLIIMLRSYQLIFFIRVILRRGNDCENYKKEKDWNHCENFTKVKKGTTGETSDINNQSSTNTLKIKYGSHSDGHRFRYTIQAVY